MKKIISFFLLFSVFSCKREKVEFPISIEISDAYQTTEFCSVFSRIFNELILKRDSLQSDNIKILDSIAMSKLPLNDRIKLSDKRTEYLSFLGAFSYATNCAKYSHPDIDDAKNNDYVKSAFLINASSKDTVYFSEIKTHALVKKLIHNDDKLEWVKYVNLQQSEKNDCALIAYKKHHNGKFTFNNNDISKVLLISSEVKDIYYVTIKLKNEQANQLKHFGSTDKIAPAISINFNGKKTYDSYTSERIINEGVILSYYVNKETADSLRSAFGDLVTELNFN